MKKFTFITFYNFIITLDPIHYHHYIAPNIIWIGHIVSRIYYRRFIIEPEVPPNLLQVLKSADTITAQFPY